MDAIKLYKRMERLKRRGLSEGAIGVRCRVRQWTVSRVLSLRTLDSTVADLFAGRGMITLAALREIARHPADVQRAALGELSRLVFRRDPREIQRPDVAIVMARHGRNLDRAPFPTTSCRACLRRTGVQADFFGDIAPGELDRCLDAACFARCVNAVAARRARWARKKFPGNSARNVKKKEQTND